ncbi:MAG: hypothetical protein F4X40_03125 [Chloroflexi bacterium]|nr:hypothetical protein [Chloroflexota bacterium]
MATTDVQTTIHELEAAGADPKLAAAIARAVRPQAGPSPIGILAAATALGFTLLAAGMGWLLLEIRANRSLIEASHDRIEAVTERLFGLETGVTERLTRIETLLEERLPERR